MEKSKILIQILIHTLKSQGKGHVESTVQERGMRGKSNQGIKVVVSTSPMLNTSIHFLQFLKRPPSKLKFYSIPNPSIGILSKQTQTNLSLTIYQNRVLCPIKIFGNRTRQTSLKATYWQKLSPQPHELMDCFSGRFPIDGIDLVYM